MASRGSDGSVGCVADFVVVDATWKIQYLVIDTSHWWFGKRFLVAARVGESDQLGRKNRSTSASPEESIKKSPAWNPEAGDQPRVRIASVRLLWAPGVLGRWG